MAQADGTWTFEDARLHLDDVVQRAQEEGPQHVELGGQDGVVILSRERYVALTGYSHNRPLIEFLESLDLSGLELSREDDRGRDIMLP